MWLDFTAFGMPDLNGINNTFTIVAGVIWSLPYEWFFYFSLPLLAFVFKITPPVSFIAIGILNIIGIAFWHPQVRQLMPFLSGIVASFLVRSTSFCELATRGISSVVVLFCVGVSVFYYASAYQIESLFLLSISFILIACGNTIFGFLKNRISLFLGELSYSIYLLHGMMLFIFFNFIVGTVESKTLSPIIHWLFVVGITPILISLCFMTYRFIERPFIQSTTSVTSWFRSHLNWHFE
jgi:peptidoglycan/LPS O-acetylase OafA/YrhL